MATKKEKLDSFADKFKKYQQMQGEQQRLTKEYSLVKHEHERIRTKYDDLKHEKDECSYAMYKIKKSGVDTEKSTEYLSLRGNYSKLEEDLQKVKKTMNETEYLKSVELSNNLFTCENTLKTLNQELIAMVEPNDTDNLESIQHKIDFVDSCIEKYDKKEVDCIKGIYNKLEEYHMRPIPFLTNAFSQVLSLGVNIDKEAINKNQTVAVFKLLKTRSALNDAKDKINAANDDTGENTFRPQTH